MILQSVFVDRYKYYVSFLIHLVLIVFFNQKVKGYQIIQVCIILMTHNTLIHCCMDVLRINSVVVVHVVTHISFIMLVMDHHKVKFDSIICQHYHCTHSMDVYLIFLNNIFVAILVQKAIIFTQFLLKIF